MAALLAALGVGGAEVPAIAGATGATGASLAIPTGVGQAATTGLLGTGGALGSSGILPQLGIGGLQGYLGMQPQHFGLNPQTFGNVFGQLSRPMGDQGNQDQTLALLLQEVLRRRGMV